MIALLRKQYVYNLFKEYFGEDRVDMQGNKILIWWPEVMISNEHDESHTIKNLYARVQVENNGCLFGTFGLTRTEYTQDEWTSKYCHSHVPRICTDNEYDLREWRQPCLGSGPIGVTCSSLNYEYDEDVWRLFIFELDKYVGHESIEGGPYIRLNTIGANNEGKTYVGIPSNTTRKFFVLDYEEDTQNMIINALIKRIVETKPFRFNFTEGCYDIAENPIDLVIKVSDIFIDWYNSLTAVKQNKVMILLTKYNSFRKCKIDGDRIVALSDDIDSDGNFGLEGINILTFKGENKTLKITKTDNTEFENYIHVLSPSLIMYVIHKILRTINYRFNGTDKERASRTKEKVRYF